MLQKRRNFFWFFEIVDVFWHLIFCCWVFFLFLLDFFCNLLNFLRLNYYFLNFWISFGMFEIIWINFKVTKVTTTNYGVYTNSVKSLFFARRAKKASAKGWSPLQEPEVSQRSGLYLLVWIKRKHLETLQHCITSVRRQFTFEIINLGLNLIMGYQLC